MNGVFYIAYNPGTKKHCTAVTEVLALAGLIDNHKCRPKKITVYRVMGQEIPPTMEGGYIRTEPNAIQEIYMRYTADHVRETINPKEAEK